MITWLTDVPDSASPFLGGNAVWSPMDSTASAVAADLAEQFNPNQPMWVTHTMDDAGVGESLILLIDTAARSQFDTMLEVVRSSICLPDRVVCLALTGSRFRGQRERSWSALRGNLHLTARYRLQCPAAESQAAITMIPAVASAEAILAASSGRIEPRIKWVNDVFVAGKKVSGVLSSTQISGALIDSVVFGIGMNIREKPDIQPTPFVPEAGCLANFDETLSDALPQLFHEVVRQLDTNVDRLLTGQGSLIFDHYRRHAGFIGERVAIWPEGSDRWQEKPLYRGRVVELNPDLSLVLEGYPKPIRSGRLSYESSWQSFDDTAKMN